MRRRETISLLALSIVCLLAVTAAVGPVLGDDDDSGKGTVKGRLSGFQENPSVSSTGKGKFTATIDDQVNLIEYELTYRGLEGGDSLFAHVHFSQRGVNGGVMFFLCGGGDKPPCPPVEGTVTGVVDPTDIIGPTGQGIEPGSFEEAVRALRSGNTYANIHTTRWPGGEIRGQISDDNDVKD